MRQIGAHPVVKGFVAQSYNKGGITIFLLCKNISVPFKVYLFQITFEY
jgi:hypothetical protein